MSPKKCKCAMALSDKLSQIEYYVDDIIYFSKQLKNITDYQKGIAAAMLEIKKKFFTDNKKS